MSTSVFILSRHLVSECLRINSLFYYTFLQCRPNLGRYLTWCSFVPPTFKMLLKTKTCRHHQKEQIDLYRYQGTGRKLYIMKVDATNVISFTLTPPESSSLCRRVRSQVNVLTQCALLCRIINISNVTRSPAFVAFPRYWGWNRVHTTTRTALTFKQGGKWLLDAQRHKLLCEQVSSRQSTSVSTSYCYCKLFPAAFKTWCNFSAKNKTFW
jgi:hypothetical protein